MRKIFTSILILIAHLSYGQNAEIDDLLKLYNSQNFKLVIEKAKPLLEKDPNNVDLNLILGRSFADLADLKRAIPYLEAAVKHDIYNSWRKAWALDYLGTCYFMLQDYTISETSLKECIKLNATKNVTNDAYGRHCFSGLMSFIKNGKL